MNHQDPVILILLFFWCCFMIFGLYPYNCLCICLQSTKMMDSFMRMAKSNTDRNLETCGVLAGSLVSAENFSTLWTNHMELSLHQ